MTPRLNISFSLKSQKVFWYGDVYSPQPNEYLLNHARTGIVMALRAVLPEGGRVGVVAYNCHTVANAIVEAGCTPVFIDITEDLHIDIKQLANKNIDAIVVTNLFGIQNDISAIRAILNNTPIIVDNAHGYGLPSEGDFTVYSINQGKFPAIGEGGILIVNNDTYAPTIQQQYDALPTYSTYQSIKLFITMLIKAWMHIPCIYGLITRRMKAHRGAIAVQESIVLRRMAKGVSRMYQQVLPSIASDIDAQKQNAQHIADVLIANGLATRVWYGENAFMAIAEGNKDAIQAYCSAQGIETATHFSKAIDWAQQFGYTMGDCPISERKCNTLIMIPTYRKIL